MRMILFYVLLIFSTVKERHLLDLGKHTCNRYTEKKPSAEQGGGWGGGRTREAENPSIVILKEWVFLLLYF